MPILLIILFIFILVWITPYMMNDFTEDVSQAATSIDIVAFAWAFIIIVGGLLVIGIIGAVVYEVIKFHKDKKERRMNG